MRAHVRIGLVGLAVLVASTQSAHAATIEIGSALVSAGASGQIVVTLRSDGQPVKGAINEIEFTSAAQIVSCIPNPAYASTAAINLLPETCEPGSTCTTVRAVVALLTGSFPDVTELYACDVAVAAGTSPAQYELGCRNASASDPDGMPVSVECSSGFVEVRAASCLGDKDSSGSIEATDVVATVLCFAQDDLTLNPAADGSGNSSCDANEVVQVIDNFAKDECKPFHE